MEDKLQGLLAVKNKMWSNRIDLKRPKQVRKGLKQSIRLNMKKVAEWFRSSEIGDINVKPIGQNGWGVNSS